MNREYKIDLYDGHLIIHDGGKTLLIDTGSPISLTNMDSFEFMGRQFKGNQSIGGKGIADVCTQLGREIDVLAGLDVISHFTFIIDYRNQTLQASDDESAAVQGCKIPLNNMGAITVLMSVDGSQYNFALDTGAKISYIRRSATSNDQPVEQRNDFNPLLGYFTTPIFAKQATIGDLTFDCKFGNLPQMAEMALSMASIDGVIGFDLFDSFTVALDLRHAAMYLTPFSET